MRKKSNIFIIVFGATVTICLAFLLISLTKSEKEVFSFMNFNYAHSDESLKVVSENNFDLENINDINFELDVDDINFVENTENQIKIIEKCTRELTEKEQLKITQDSKIIDISRNSELNLKSLGKSFKRELIVYLPKSYDKNLKLQLSVGDINFDSALNMNNIELKLSTGDVNFNKSVKCNSFALEGITGDLNINSLLSKNYAISVNTGSIKVSNLSGMGYIYTTTGDIYCDIYNLTGNTDFSSSVGDINLNIKKESNFIINASCDIGEIKTDFKENSVGTNPTNILTIDSGCGDVNINKNY